MKIAHFVGRSMVRFTPGRIAAYWGRYTEHQGRAFCLGRDGGWQFQEPLNPYGFYCVRGAPKAPFNEWIEQCDVLHFHDDSYPTRLEARHQADLRGKTLVYHAHIGNIPMRFWSPDKHPRNHKFPWMQDVRHAAITNGYGHLFDEHQERSGGKYVWGRLPDVLDLEHPTYQPLPVNTHVDSGRADDGRLRVVYTYSNAVESGKINAKRPKAHARLASSVKGVEYVSCCNRPFEEAMDLKRSADVVLEEVFTPYLHLSALEGAAVGKCVVTKFNESTMRELNSVVGASADEWPFMYADENTLPDVLAHLRGNPDLVAAWGVRARRWMEKYYGAGKLLKIYERFYGRGD